MKKGISSNTQVTIVTKTYDWFVFLLVPYGLQSKEIGISESEIKDTIMGVRKAPFWFYKLFFSFISNCKLNFSVPTYYILKCFVNSRTLGFTNLLILKEISF